MSHHVRYPFCQPGADMRCVPEVYLAWTVA